MGVTAAASRNPACDATGGNAAPGTGQPGEVLLRVHRQAAHVPLALPLKRGAGAGTTEDDPPQRAGFRRATDATAVARFAPGGFRRCRSMENPADLILVFYEHRQRDFMRHFGPDHAPLIDEAVSVCLRERAKSG